MSGDDVRSWQLFLRGRDLLEEVTGTFDSLTLRGSQRFQQTNGLEADGVIGIRTLAIAEQRFNFHILEDTDDAEDGPNWPPRPTDLKPLSGFEARAAIFSPFRYEAAPIKGNPEAIRILDGWVGKNITKIEIPQLWDVPGTYGVKTFNFHMLVAEQFRAFFKAVDDAGLKNRILTFDGAWVARFVRGSKTSLSNHCVPPTSTVYTLEGPAEIGDLKGFEGKVWSFKDGAVVPGRVTRFFENGVKPLLRIRATGHEITCTPDHPVLVLRKRSLPKEDWIYHRVKRGAVRALYWTEMVQAAELRIGDRIVAVKALPSESRADTSRDLDWAEIVGLFLGDGCIHHLHGKAEFISFCFPEGDRVRTHVQELLTRYFGEAPKETSQALIYYKEHIWSKFLFMDRPATEKTLPPEIWTWSLPAKLRLALGLVYSDGTVIKALSSSGGGHSARFSFRWGSRGLAEGTRSLLNWLGLRTSLLHVEKAQDSITIAGVPTRAGPCFHFTAIDAQGVLHPDADPLYAERIASAAVANTGRSRCSGYETVGPDFSHHPVTHIEHVGSAPVVDIEVDEHHNFLASGVVVSNCFGTAIDLNAAWNGFHCRPALKGHQGSLRELVPIANHFGLFWGGHFGENSQGQIAMDGMHFEVAKLWTP